MRKPFFAFAGVLCIVLAQFIISAPVRKPIRVDLNADYLRAMGAYKRLESRLPREELRVITTIGILNGARHAEQQMERNLVATIKRLLLGADRLNDDELIAGIKNIEKQLTRDHRALLILTSAMDLVTGAKDVYDFKSDMQQTLQQIRRQSEGAINEEEAPEPPVQSVDINSVAEQVAAFRRQITQQVRAMKDLVEEKVAKTLDYLISKADEGSLLEQASKKVVRKRDVLQARELPAEVRMIKSILTEARIFPQQEDFRNNLVDAHIDMRNDAIVDDSAEDDFALQSEVNKSKIVIEKRSNNRSTPHTSSDSSKATTTTTITTATAIRSARAKNRLSTRAAGTPTTTTSPNTSASVSGDTNGPKSAKQEELPGNPTGPTSTTVPAGPIFPTGLSFPTGPSFATGPSFPTGPLRPIGPIGEFPLAPLEAEDDDFPSAPPPPPDGAGGGGLVGIITSLSGGEGGSDIGALIGALTGVISTLFGPGGLDIESLISTATSLISGLLAGNKNFGTVLGIYIGTAFDGLSGGGGAINNGQFFGNLLGTVYAQLSADPEDDDLRPNPLLFARNLISSFVEAKNRKESDEEGNDERRSDAHTSQSDKNKGDASGGSDSGGFIKQIASHLVSSLVSLLLNASLGASGGASHASTSLFASSSHKGSGGGQKH